MTAIALKVLSWVLPILLGPLVYLGARELLNVSERIDDLPPTAKRIAVVIFGTLVSAVFGVLGVTAPQECLALAAHGISSVAEFTKPCAEALVTKAPVQGVVAALTAMVIHQIKKSNPRS